MSIAPPGGTLTFLFTDIEGSTQLWEKHPEAMKLALARHDGILHQAIEAHGGYVFKTVGDAFYAAFISAPDAAAAALDAQRGIQAENWGETPIKVRMALHTGAVELRANDYFGPPLNRVARLIAAGHGGQTLLSTITYELICASLPANAELRDMGERGLKDLVRPERIYQLTASGLQAEFPPLKTLEAFRTNLPQQLTSFIGREKEISAVKTLIKSNRLTTLTGSGGAGKTRLSLQVAADLLDSFPDGVWFIELAPLSDPALVLQTVTAALGLREEGSRPLLDRLTDYLKTKTLLLILDNCEHVVNAAASLARALLQACPTLRLLVSSREALGVPGETIYYVPSLSTPDPHLVHSPATIMQFEATHLFVDRAQAALPGFCVTSDNAPALAQICARLDGIPLAIELAAARVKMLKLEQIAQRLDDRFRLLTGGSRTSLPRQQTLRAMIDWSYDLLPEHERALLRRLSVFAGGWTLEAAEMVCQGRGIDDYDVLEPLSQLVNKSLVVADAEDIVPGGYSTRETRYRLLETVRQYAREKLAETDDGMAVRDLHLEYFLGLAQRAEPELVGPHVMEWLQLLDAELDNIRAALEWSLNRAPLLGLRLANTLLWFWARPDYFRDGFHWFMQLLKQPEAQKPTLVRARALGIYSYLGIHGYIGAHGYAGVSAEALRPILSESMTLCKELGDQQGLAFISLIMGIIAFFKEDDVKKAEKLFAESLAIYRTLGDKPGIAYALMLLGGNLNPCDYQKASTYLTEAVTICREIGYLRIMEDSLRYLGTQELWQGNYRIARALLEESLMLARQLGNINISLSLMVLGNLALREADYIQACAYYEESLFIANQTEDLIFISLWVPSFLGYASLRLGELARARQLFEGSLQRLKDTGEKICIVYTVEGLASLSLLEGLDPARTVSLFAWADVAREALANLRSVVEQADVDRDLAVIHTQLDDEAFAAAQAQGRAMSMEDAIAFAVAKVPN